MQEYQKRETMRNRTRQNKKNFYLNILQNKTSFCFSNPSNFLFRNFHRRLAPTCAQGSSVSHLVFTFLIDGKLHPLAVVPHVGHWRGGLPKRLEIY